LNASGAVHYIMRSSRNKPGARLSFKTSGQLSSSIQIHARRKRMAEAKLDGLNNNRSIESDDNSS
jgi:hypothetical protein